MRSKIAGVWKVGVLASGLSLLLTPLARVTAQQPAQNEVNEGARVYGATCGRCHNPRSPLERDDRDWIAIANHMRVRANLTGKEVRSVIAFLQATNTDPRERMPLGPEQRGPAPGRVPEVSTGPASEDRGMIERGETLTSQRACLGCHVIGSAGGAVGPSLNGAVARRGAAFVRRKLIDPTFDNASSMMPNFGLSAEEVEAIVAYLNTLRRR